MVHELDQRLRADARNVGDFSRIHPLPQSSQDVPDDLDARLVVLRIDDPYSKEPGSPAEVAAKAIFESRGNTPRLYRNTPFLAADKTRLQDLDEAVRKYLAWESILDERVTLNLTPQQVKQAETQRDAADGAVAARIPEVYFWLLVPVQKSPQEAVKWQAFRLPSGHDALAVRQQEAEDRRIAGHRLRRHEPRGWNSTGFPSRHVSVSNSPRTSPATPIFRGSGIPLC